ncbi:hypothetical protein V2P53_03220 [Mycoplasma capricolum subsp. capricolum]
MHNCLINARDFNLVPMVEVILYKVRTPAQVAIIDNNGDQSPPYNQW